MGSSHRALALVGGALGFALTFLSFSNDTEEERIKRILQGCQSFSRDGGEFRVFLSGLASRRDYRALEAISRSSLPFHYFADEEMVKSLPPADAVQHCRKQMPGTMNWRASLLMLSRHPKALVLPYLFEMVRHPMPAVRHACYKLCSIMRWDDLAGYAHADVHDSSLVCLPNSDEVTLGIMASHYLAIVDRNQPPHGMKHLEGLTPQPQ